jgi:hypothetical protein
LRQQKSLRKRLNVLKNQNTRVRDTIHHCITASSIGTAAQRSLQSHREPSAAGRSDSIEARLTLPSRRAKLPWGVHGFSTKPTHTMAAGIPDEEFLGRQETTP